MGPALRLAHGGFKFIKAPRPELYDLASDASENDQRIDAQQARASELARTLDEALRQRTATGAARPVDPETAEAAAGARLCERRRQALRPAGAALRDPKDGIRLLPHLNRGMSAARTEPEVAIRS